MYLLDTKYQDKCRTPEKSGFWKLLWKGLWYLVRPVWPTPWIYLLQCNVAHLDLDSVSVDICKLTYTTVRKWKDILRNSCIFTLPSRFAVNLDQRVTCSDRTYPEVLRSPLMSTDCQNIFPYQIIFTFKSFSTPECRGCRWPRSSCCPPLRQNNTSERTENITAAEIHFKNNPNK